MSIGTPMPSLPTVSAQPFRLQAPSTLFCNSPQFLPAGDGRPPCAAFAGLPITSRLVACNGHPFCRASWSSIGSVGAATLRPPLESAISRRIMAVEAEATRPWLGCRGSRERGRRAARFRL
jgi:hypothetical protein